MDTSVDTITDPYGLVPSVYAGVHRNRYTSKKGRIPLISARPPLLCAVRFQSDRSSGKTQRLTQAKLMSMAHNAPGAMAAGGCFAIQDDNDTTIA